MAVKRLEPYALGDTIKLRGPRNGAVTVVAPDGLQLIIPAPNGSASLWLAQTGTWHVAWNHPGHPATTLQVAAPEPDADPTPARMYDGPGA